MSDERNPWLNYGDADFATYGGCLVRGDADDPMCFDVLLAATPFDTGVDGRYLGCLARVDLSDLSDGLAADVVDGMLPAFDGPRDAEGLLAGIDHASLAAMLVDYGDNECIQAYETFHDGLVFTGALGPEPMSAADARGLMEWAGVDPGLIPEVPVHDAADGPDVR